MNPTFPWRRHWKLIALLVIVMVLLLTVFGDVEITVPEYRAAPRVDPIVTRGEQ